MIPFQTGKCLLLMKYGFMADPVNVGQKLFHGGVDLICMDSTRCQSKNVLSISEGIVLCSRIVTLSEDEDWRLGHYVAVQGDDGVIVYYCHLLKRSVRKGQRVHVGDIIGIEGQSGDAEQPHLHLECRKDNIRMNAAQYLGIENKRGIYVDPSLCDEPTAPPPRFRHGTKVIILPGATYQNGKRISRVERSGVYTIHRTLNGCALLKETWRWVPAQYLKRYEKN